MALISSKTTEDKRVELEIKVDEEVFAPVVERIIKKRISQLTLPGFRKGKAPRSLIIKTYGMGVFLEDAVNELYPTAYNEAVAEAGIEPVEVADIEMTSVDEKGFSFKATVAVKPEVELGEYKGIAVTKVVAPVEESAIDNQISALRERNARIISANDRPAKDGDIATIDFEGFIDGVPFEGGKGEGHPLTLGSGAFIPGFEAQIVGKSVGESFDVNVDFPQEYGVPELNGKPAVFKVHLHELQEKELPEVDDEFAMDISEFDTIDEYRADLRAKLEETAQKNADTALENDLMKEVVAGMKVDLPAAMVERRIDELVYEFDQRLRMQGLNMEQFLSYTGEDTANFRATFEPKAHQQTLVRLALEAIVKAEGLTPSDEQIEAEYERMAGVYGIDTAKVKSLVPLEDMKLDLACNMALDIVKSAAVVTLAQSSDENVGEEQAAKKEEEPQAELEAEDKADLEAEAKDKNQPVGESAPKAKAAKKATKKVQPKDSEAEDKGEVKKPARKRTAKTKQDNAE